MRAEKQEACNQIMRFSDAANEIEGREHDSTNGVEATIARPSVNVALNTLLQKVMLWRLNKFLNP